MTQNSPETPETRVKRVTVHIRVPVWKRLKNLTNDRETTITDEANRAIKAYLESELSTAA